MSTRFGRLLAWTGPVVAALLVMLTAAGCSESLKKTHAQNVSAAEARFRGARSDLILKMAQRQFDAGDLDQAHKSLTDALSLDPDNPRLHLLAGRIALERGQLEHAGNLFRFAIELDPRLPLPYYYYGVVLQRWQQYDHALTQYQMAYELEKDNPAFLIAATEMLVALDRWEEALAQLHEKLYVFDQNAGIRVAIGQIHLVRGQFEQAADYFRQAALLRPDDTQIGEALATAYAGAGQYDKAGGVYEGLLTQPELAGRRDLQRALLECYMRQGRYADAKRVGMNLSRSDPTDVDAWAKLGETALELNDPSGALLAANRVKALAPQRHEGYLLSGIVLQRRGQLERALSELDKAAELAPQSASPVIMRGLALESAGRRAEAADAYREALSRQPNNPQARQLLVNVERN